MLVSAVSLVTGWRRSGGADPAAVNTTEPPSTPYAANPVERTPITDRAAPTSYSLIGW
jgi:hypothetical protein